MNRLGLVLAFLLAFCSSAIAQTKWDSGNKGAGISLSGSDLIATSGGGTNYTVRGTDPTKHIVGTDTTKVVFTISFDAAASSAGRFDWNGGVQGASCLFADGGGGSGLPGFNACSGGDNTLGFQTAGRGAGASSGGASVCRTDAGTPSTGLMWFAINLNTGKAWCNNTCVWAANTPDSSANQLSTLPNGTYYVAWGSQDNATTSATLNTNPTLAGCSGLSGFVTWEGNDTSVLPGGGLLLRGVGN